MALKKPMNFRKYYPRTCLFCKYLDQTAIKCFRPNGPKFQNPDDDTIDDSLPDLGFSTCSRFEKMYPD